MPFVMGSPMSIPNMFTVRVHAMRLLRDKLPIVIDAVEPGGSGDMYAGLNEEEAAALREATRMGFPPRVWFSHNEIGAGALPVLTYAVDQMDPAYYTDFWTLPGYLGSDPNGSAVRDRFRFETTVGSVVLPENAYKTDDMGVDDAWQTLAVRYESDPKIVLADTPETPAYADGTKICITSGAAAGLKLPMNVLSGNTVTVGAAFGMGDITVALSAVQPGDRVVLDNSDYIALQTYHRHQVPGPEYPAWDQFRDAGGVPIYPQRKVIVGPMVAFSGAGSVQSGFFSGKMITIASLLDESALPWQPDWYRKKVREHFAEGTDDVFRLWYSDNAMHGGDYTPELGAHVVSYRAALNQALLDLSNWVERGIQPADNSAYEIVDAQVHIPAEAAQRKGIQPVVGLTVQGEKMASIPVGGTVDFEGYIEAPPGAGVVTGAAFDFDGSGQYAYKVEALAYLDADRQSAHVRVSYAFDKAGTYFPSLRGTISRIGAERDPYTQVKNLARVRVVVKG